MEEDGVGPVFELRIVRVGDGPSGDGCGGCMAPIKVQQAKACIQAAIQILNDFSGDFHEKEVNKAPS